MSNIPTILIVDDDPFFLEFYKAELVQYGFNVECAKDGEEGVIKTKELKPDVVLLDVILPKMDGFAVLEAIKQDDEIKHIPVIIISALGLSADVDRLLKLGAIKHFKKINVLPKDIAEYLKDLVKNRPSAKKTATPAKPASTHPAPPSPPKASAVFEKSKVATILKEGLRDLNVSLEKFFAKKVVLGDVNISTIPFLSFQDHISQISSLSGSIFVYSIITGEKKYGVALLSMKESDITSLIELVQQGISGKSLGMGVADQVVEEFFNIIANAGLSKLFSSVEDNVILPPPIITDSRSVDKLISQLKAEDGDGMVVFVEQAYSVGDAGLNFSFFVSFYADCFKESE